jgi:hypothetical protein
MLPGRQILLFCVRSVALYALLAAPWPGVREGYAAAFHRAAGVFLGTFGQQGIVRFRPMTAGYAMQDTEIEMVHRRGGGQRIGYNASYAGYLPTALLISLIVSTPVSWRRRGWALAWGLLLIHLFILLRVWLLLLYEFRTGAPVGFYDFGAFTRLSLRILVEGISVSPVTSCIVPVLIWILVTFRRQDAAVLVKRTE